MSAAQEPSRSARVVILQAQERLDVPLRGLTELLAQCIASDFGEAVLILRIEVEAGAHRVEAASREEHPRHERGVDHMLVSASNEPSAVAAAKRAIERWSPSYAVIFLDAHEKGLHVASVAILADRPILITAEKSSVACPCHGELLVAELLSDAPSDVPHELPATMSPWNLRRCIGEDDGSPLSRAVPFERVLPERCRVRLNLRRIASMTQPSLKQLSVRERVTLSRLSRAVTRRRVGLALGGSGVWAYAHVLLIRKLIERGIPVDMVSGSSSGALVGAYYCVRGLDGLELLVKRSKTLFFLLAPALLTMQVMERMVEADLGSLSVDAIEIPIFPVVANLTTGMTEVMTSTRLGFAVRASTSLPGLFGSTIARGAIYVDGAVSNNVPGSVVAAMGADLVIASNTLPAPRARPVLWSPKTHLGRLFQEANPATRFFDMLTSLSLRFHATGNSEARAAGAKVLYMPLPKVFPVIRTLDFLAAKRVMEETERDPQFIQAIDAAEREWKSLSQSRRVLPMNGIAK